MSFYDNYTTMLHREADDSQCVLDVLTTYREMGESDFASDLRNFLDLPMDLFHKHADQARLKNVISDIRHDMVEYRKIRCQINDAIREIQTTPSRGVNDFGRNLYVYVLRGSGFCERYGEDVHYALEHLTHVLPRVGS
jgi:hypothetical protein